MKLTKSGLLHLRGAEGTEIRCAGGQLWITEEGITADFFLSAGERHRVRSGGQVVVEALRDATLEIVRVNTSAAWMALAGLRPAGDSP